MISWWRKKRKIARLPGIKVDPVTVLAQTLEKARNGQLKSVYIGLQWEDDSFDADWSTMKRSDLCTHAVVAQHHAQSEIGKD
jgi:hypothetical protein